MARPIEQQLRKAIMASGLHFLRDNGNLRAKDIYRLVKIKFADLCDDNYLCNVHCRNGYNSPEWHHTVRSAIQSFKKKGIISYVDKRWVLNS